MKRRDADSLPLVIQWGALLAAVALFVVGLRIILEYIPFASDWELYFRPAAQGWIDGSQALYELGNWTTGYWNPPWMLWLLLPLMVWPVWLGWALIVVSTFLVMAWLTKGYPKRWLVFTSPLIVDLIVNGQVEVIPMLGIALGWLAGDRPILLGVALVLMATKPQSSFLVALWLFLHHRRRLRALAVPAAIFALSLLVHGWDWPLRWASGPSVFHIVSQVNNSAAWRSIGNWMIPVALALGWWSLRLPRTRRNLGAVVAANMLVIPYMSSHSLLQVLTFSLLPLGTGWAVAGWLASFSVFLRGWFGKPAVHLDFAIAAVLMIGYLLHADRRPGPGERAP